MSIPYEFPSAINGAGMNGAARPQRQVGTPIVLSDAIVKTAAGTEPHPLLGDAPEGTTVSRIVQRASHHPELRGHYRDSAAVVVALLELDAAGVLRVSPSAVGDRLRRYYETGRVNGDRSLAYVATYERNWQSYRHLYDFVEADDANHVRKIFQRDLYLQHLRRHLDLLPRGTRVLDAGCGVGRLTGELIDRGHSVTCTDASAQALKCAVRVGLHHGASATSLDARLCDLRDLSGLEDGSFPASIALEVLCYQEDPLESLQELIRVTAPGGLLVLSVEGLHGSSLYDPKIGLGEATSVLDTAALDVENEISVRYFTKHGLRDLLETAGLEGVEIVGTQYTADGIFDRLATDEALTNEEGIEKLAALEAAAATDPALEPLARAWLATARVPGASH